MEISKIIISKIDYRSQHKFFQKRATDIYNSYSNIFIVTSTEKRKKHFYIKVRYLNLKEFKSRQNMAKIRAFSQKLTSRTAKWYIARGPYIKYVGGRTGEFLQGPWNVKNIH